jgi:putative colanic acid biosynthesis acetyltransferase WcaF
MSGGAPWRDPLLRRLYWRFLGRPLFRLSFHNWYPVRRALLRLGGARITARTRFRPSVSIDRPWNLAAGRLTIFGDHVTLRAGRAITVGDRCVISQHVILTSEARDPRRAGCPAIASPITIEDDCWIATDTLVLPGAVVREGTVVGARSLVRGELPPWTIATGEPAVPRRPRRLATSPEANRADGR